MAILGKFEVNVIVDGKEAREYDDDDDDDEVVTPEEAEEAHSPPTVTRYVEAVSGAFFGFRVCVDESYIIGQEDHIAARVYVDGEYAVGRMLPVEPLPRSSKRRLRSRICSHISYVPGSGPNSRIQEKLRFSDIKLCQKDTGNDLELKAKYCKLGTFRVKLWRVRKIDLKGDLRVMNHFNRTSIGDAIPEKALKGKRLDVATSFVPDPTIIPQEVCSADYLDSAPIAVFHFKYQTRGGLQSLLVIPRSPSPVPLEDRPVEELSRDEMVELLQRQREQLQVKQERPTKSEGQNGKSVKRERDNSPGMSSAPKFSKGPRGEKIYHLDSD